MGRCRLCGLEVFLQLKERLQINFVSIKSYSELLMTLFRTFMKVHGFW